MNFTREGVSSNLSPSSRIQRFVFIIESTVPLRLPSSRPAGGSPWPACSTSPASNGFPVSGHRFPPKQLQSVEKINPSLSTRFKQATMNRGRDAAWEGRRRHCRPTVSFKSSLLSTSNQKKSTGRKRRRWRTHQREEKELQITRRHPTPTTDVLNRTQALELNSLRWNSRF
jgi:hypothetical protein